MSQPIEHTIILTVSVRVTVETEADLDTICSNLEGVIASAENNGQITDGCGDDTSVTSITTDTEVVDDEE